MDLRKCCVGNCPSTTKTRRLFFLPKDDNLRELWLKFLIPTNAELSGLSKNQLLMKRVCQDHFDRYQFDGNGNRLRFGYPCLFSAKEIRYGIPLSSTVHNDHSYCKKQKDIEEHFTDVKPMGRKAGPIKPVPEQKRTQSENFEICINKENNKYVVYVQEFNANIEEESPDVKFQPNAVELEDLKPLPEPNDSATLPDQEEDKNPIAPTTDDSQNVSHRKPLGMKNKKLKIAAKRLNILKSEVLRQRQIIESLQEKLNYRTANPLYYDKAKCLDIVTKNMTECGKIFTRMQCYQSQLKPHARRFNMKEKVLALTMYKTSSKCYRLLCNYFAMPSTKSLSRLLSSYTLKGDLNKGNEE